MDDEYTKSRMQKMLCCFRRRGKYTTSVIHPDYADRQTTHVTIPVPSQPRQHPPIIRPEPTNTPSDAQLARPKSDDKVPPIKDSNFETVKIPQETPNHVSLFDKAEPKRDENPTPVARVEETNKSVNIVEVTKSVKTENTEPTAKKSSPVENEVTVINTKDNINSGEFDEETYSRKIENTESITKVLEIDPSNNIVGKTESVEVPKLLESSNPDIYVEDIPLVEVQNTQSVNKVQKYTAPVPSAGELTLKESERKISVDKIRDTSINVVSEEPTKETEKESKTEQIITTQQILDQTPIPTSEKIVPEIDQSNENIAQVEDSTSTVAIQKRNTQSKKAQANTHNTLTAVSVGLTKLQTERNKSEENLRIIENPEQEDEMERSRKKISANVDTSDITGIVPFSPRRSSLLPTHLMKHDIEEVSEDSEGPQDEIESDDDSDHGNPPSKVTFAKERRRGGIREAITVDKTMEIPKYPKSAEDVLHLTNAFAANDFLQSVLKGETLYKVIDAMSERNVTAGEIIIQEGDPGNNLYVSMRGTYEIYVKKKLFGTFSDKRVFGELAILYNSKRLATIKAISNGKVWVIKRSVYQQVVVQSAIQEFEETLLFLRNVPLVNKLNDESLTKITNLLQKEFFKTDTFIVKEGEPGDKFYIIRAGSVTITKMKEGKVSELGRGAFFGERALLNDEPRQATVTADAPGVECLTLTSVEFRKHFNDLSSQTAGNKSEPTAVAKPTARESAATALPQNEFSNIELEHLERRSTLGVGGFGRVELVQHRHNHKLTFALKYLKKVDMVQQEQVEHVFNERDIQISCECIFIARMYKTFKDDKYLYFLMESCLGGDLWTYLQKRKGRMVPEMEARFYAACVLEALAYLHERNTIYRDLKPENLLIDAKGYIKMTDFGFAKNLKSATKTYTFAGTPEYVAPEIIYNRGHDKSVDYWAFGILIFELLVGKTPFRTDDRTNMMTYNRILRGINSVTWPQHVTKSASHLIQKLCRPISTDRLGNQKNGIQDIRSHKWFQGFDWEKLRNEKMKAPFVPKLSSNIDTRYFEKFSDDNDIPPDEMSSFSEF